MTETYKYPNADGKYGEFGGTYVAESLIATLEELKESYKEAQQDPKFQREFDYLM